MQLSTHLEAGVEPRSVRIAMSAVLGAALSILAAQEPRAAYVGVSTVIGLVVAIALALALVRAIGRALVGTRAVRVTPTHVLHAGVSIARASLEVERSQWVHRGRVGIVATLRDGRQTLSLGARGIARDAFGSETRARPFVDACLADVAALEGLLTEIGVPTPRIDAPYRAPSRRDDARELVLVVATPPIPWWRGLLGPEVAVALAAQWIASSHGLVTSVVWLVATLIACGRMARDASIPLPTHRLQASERGLAIWDGQELRAQLAAPRGFVKLGRCDGLACLELRVATGRPPLRLVASRAAEGEREMYSPDYFVGPQDFEWLVHHTGAVPAPAVPTAEPAR